MTITVGSPEDVFRRIKSLLVPWFGDSSPNLDALLKGGATALSGQYAFYSFSKLQTRIKTATGNFLDLISQDFFGNLLQRRTGENDDSYRNRILATLLQQLATVEGMTQVLTNLTGRKPIIIEGFDPSASGYYDNTLFYDVGMGIGGIWPYQAIIYAFRPTPTKVLNINGYDNYFGYDFNAGNCFYSAADIVIIVTDQDILDLVEIAKVFGTKIYTYIFD